MTQLLDAIECGDLKKQTRTARKLAGILSRSHTTNELRESLRRWQDTRRKWVDLRQRAERAIAKAKKADSFSIFGDDEEIVRIY